MNSPERMIIMPAHNVAKVLPTTIDELPENCADLILVVDDCSTDNTAAVANDLGLEVIRHSKNRGYGGAQKTGYSEAIRRNAKAVVMVHGDNQYDPSLVHLFFDKLLKQNFDMVTGTRMVLGDALENGMPFWKYLPNRFLTGLENWAFSTDLSDYHNGYRGYTTHFLSQVPFDLLSERFDFDTDIIIQAAIRKRKIAEVPHPTRYLDENSQMTFAKGIQYGLGILNTVLRFKLHQSGLVRSPLYQSKNN